MNNQMVNESQERSPNKTFALISLVPLVLVNLIFSGPLVSAYEELIRYFQNGFQSQVLGYFFESFIVWFLISLGSFVAPFAIMKAVSIQSKQNDVEFKEKMKESKTISGNFSATKTIGSFVGFDDTRKKWALYDEFMLVTSVYSYNDIVNFELIEDGVSVAKGGLGRALVGGALFGGVGAIVGGVTGKRKTTSVCRSLKLKVTINDLNNPVVYIDFVNKETKKESDDFKQRAEAAQECLSSFQLICDREKAIEKQSSSPTNEIREFKKLLDEGIITEDEFKVKKKQLLS